MSEDKGNDDDKKKMRHVAIVGGGLAGLSVAYQLLEKTTSRTDSNDDNELEKEKICITVLDKTEVGMGGASSVAGGLLHPFSPRGKLVHLGLEGLQSSLKLLSIASEYEPSCIIKPSLYRIALTDGHVAQLQESARLYPNHCTWLDRDKLVDKCCSFVKDKGGENEEGEEVQWKGGLELTSGKVIHVPTYLKGLWKACLDLSSSSSDENENVKEETTAKWVILENETIEKKWMDKLLKEFDTVVLSAGSGLWISSSSSGEEDEERGVLSTISDDNENLVENNNNGKKAKITGKWPIQLVRGQSIELSLPKKEYQENEQHFCKEALLCGKYISPLPNTTPKNNENLVLVGATHEYDTSKSFTKDEVIDNLRSRSYDLAPWIWNKGTVQNITKGWRVQSNRGLYGRVPIVGRLSSPPPSSSSPSHEQDMKRMQGGEKLLKDHNDVWIFTGLSSRGLIHHGIYGDILTDAILMKSEEHIISKYDGIGWWHKALGKEEGGSERVKQ